MHLPPPLVYALPFVAAHFLDRWRPAPFLPAAAALVGGWLLLALGMIGIPALLAFRRARTSPLPWRPATALVTDGPFRLTRNPMYVGFTLLYLGGTALVNSAGPLAFLPVILFVMNAVVIPGEERHLAARFGEPYREYCRRVRRWL
ncbi:MAG TPA: isoprenylcysteine carboxylmethyltransferase family protein [Gemmatimonadaceae bacterium]|nr:isoprenylcysteine carboxylmethyltransferase family protein [Gemmatimonadaceae bacterium]